MNKESIDASPEANATADQEFSAAKERYDIATEKAREIIAGGQDPSDDIKRELAEAEKAFEAVKAKRAESFEKIIGDDASLGGNQEKEAA